MAQAVDRAGWWRVTGEAYRGINVLMLWLEAAETGYVSPFWMTYKQASELSGQVRKGERSTLVVNYGVVEKEGEDRQEVRRPYLRTYHVFNADQIDSLPERFTREVEPSGPGHPSRRGVGVHLRPARRHHRDHPRSTGLLPPCARSDPHAARGRFPHHPRILRDARP